MKRDLSKPLASTYGDPVKKTSGPAKVKKFMKDIQMPFRPTIMATDSLIYNMVGKTSPMVKRRADARDKVLNNQAKSKQRNPKPGPYQY